MWEGAQGLEKDRLKSKGASLLVWVTRPQPPHYYNTLLYSHWHRDSTHLEMAHYSVVFHGSTVNSVQSDFHIHNKDDIFLFYSLPFGLSRADFDR